jgi:S-adenosyl methyltransferase
MVSHGVSQFLDLGSGLPTVQNTHQIAQTVDAAARVVNVDNDPTVFLHGQALLADDASTTVVLADIRAPEALLALDEVGGFLDFSKPVGLILNAVIHHVLDEEDPPGILRTFKAALASDSYLQVTHFCDESPEAVANAEVLQRSLGRGQVRSREEITAFFDGLALVQPGVVFLPEWRPDSVLNDAAPGGTLMLCGVARKP